MITEMGVLQILVFLLTLLFCIKPLGWYISMIYSGALPSWIRAVGRPLEQGWYRLSRIKPNQEMDWKGYLFAMLLFNGLGWLVTYVIQRVQAHLPLNPQHLFSLSPDLAFNTAVSFATNTDWQSYAGETTVSYFTQMLALTSQNFMSAATGLSLFFAFCRGISRHETTQLGNFWVDMTRSTIYLFLPLSAILCLLLVSQGGIQNLKGNETATSLQSLSQSNLTQQTIPMGPVASQVAIKQLGSNGGGFFNVNSAHPFENPTPLTNFFEMLAIVLIPAALCYTFGVIVNDKRQGWAILFAMFMLFVPSVFLASYLEQQGNPVIGEFGVPLEAMAYGYPGGNMEGKETRFGIISSTLWAVTTTSGSNGSVNSMHDSYTPLGGGVLLLMMHFGEVVFGGVGSGLYGMLMLVIITVFVAGLMVGRTPEYLGKKIEPYEMKMAAMAVLIMPLIVLLATAVASVTSTGVGAIGNPGAHGFSEILYAFTSTGNNNGSAFAGLNANTLFYNLIGGFLMLISRYWIAIPVIAIAGSMAEKKIIPKSSGTLLTHTPLFIMLLMGVIILIGALSFFPALALGPIVEQLNLWGYHD